MDSLTQIVLGAACGEIALGKKIGNKALLFGAIGGTIPDLDVFIGRFLYDNEIQAMAFHRGIMHAIPFAILGCFVFGFLNFKLYNTRKRFGTSNLKDWVWLYFLSIFTHPILDCFTPYGTQLFAPFSDYRVAFNTISVVDPLYTLPFFICMIVVLFFKRTNLKRLLWTKTGIYISTCYLLFTVGNKFYIDSIFKTSFKKNKISFTRFSSQPTLLNNILWYAVAEDKDNYYATFYSLFDHKNYTDIILTIPKNHHLLDMSDNNLKILTWFSNDYFNLYKKEKNGRYKYVDLRYPMVNPDDINTSIFNFTIYLKNNKWDILPFDGNPPNRKDFKAFTTRLKGV